MTDGPGDCLLTIYVVLHRFPRGLELLSMSARRGIVSTNTDGRAQKGGRKCVGARHPRSDCPVDLLSEQEFQAHFHILDNISILLVDDEPLTSEKRSHNATYFRKEQFNARLCFLLPIFSSNSSISPRFLQHSFIPMLSGYWWDAKS